MKVYFLSLLSRPVEMICGLFSKEGKVKVVFGENVSNGVCTSVFMRF
jgi:hypothetical protein